MNQTGYGGNGCVKDYFMEVSYNQLNLQITLTNWVQVSQTHDYYGPESKWGEFALDAISAADVAGVNFAAFDNDGDGIVEAVSIVHQGAGQESTANTNDIWSHMWTLEEAGFSENQRSFDGVLLNTYICQPEDDGTGNINTIGIMCHEIGHLLGAPDFYDTDYTNPDYRGTGFWDLQADGFWNGNPMGSSPAHPNLFTKTYYYNWLDAIELTYPITINMLETDLYQQAYFYTTSNENEFFLLENQQQSGFDAALPGHGLLIYHVDQNYIDTHFENNDINAGPHQGLSIEDAGANGIIDDADCPFPGTTINLSFTDYTTPSALNWSGNPTNKPIVAINENYNMISFDFMDGSGCVPPPLQCDSLTATNISDHSIGIQWKRGFGEKVLVIVKANSPLVQNPNQGIPYITNQEFGLGELIEPDAFAVYYDDGNSCQINNLDPGTDYYFYLYEAFITNNCYKLPPLTNSFTTTGTPLMKVDNVKENISLHKSNNVLFFSTPEDSQYKFKIYNIQGQMVLSGTTNQRTSIEHLPIGLYNLVVSTNLKSQNHFKICKF
jgi:M6 family metalloprotease-like protein